MNSFYTKDELTQFGFKAIGDGVLISKKASIYGAENISLGNQVRIDDFCILSGKISLGSYIHIGAYCALYGAYGIEMEDYTGLSPRCTVFSATDDFSGDYLIGPLVEKEKTNVFQFRNRFIISSIKSGLVLIDQQRAYERIVYEQYLDRINQSQQVVQQELFPCQVSFSLSDAELIDEIMAELNVLGFHLNKLGKNTFVVSGTPSGIEETDLQSLFESFLENYKKNLIELDLDKSTNLARSLAGSLSVRSARKLYTEEMGHLIDELFSCKVPDRTPDGRKIFAIIPEEQVNQWLNR